MKLLIKHKFNRQLSTWLIVTLLALFLTLPTIPAQAAPVLSPMAPTPPVTGQAALDQLKARPDYPALVDAITAARYAIHPVADGSGLWAQNPAHGLNATFTAHGLTVSAPGPALNPTEPATTYRTGWRLTSLGYGAAQQPVAAGTLHYAGTRVELVRPHVTEWFVNGPSGLEQGFTLPTRPVANPDAAALHLIVQVDGALMPQVSGDGQQLTLHNAAGQVVLTYDHLKVWDATGTTLPAHLMTHGRQVQVVVDDAQARYPLTIDPTFSQQAYLKANNSEANDNFGQSVSVSNDTVVVGAPNEASNATTVNGDGSNNSATWAGAAYVFVRSGSSWSQQAYLKANNHEAGDYFGYSVAISGDTVVVGAPLEDSNATTVNGNGSNNSDNAAGAAYVFVRSGTTWSQQAYLKANNSGVQDYFGWSVAVANDTVVVGAPYEASNATTVNGDGSNNSASDAGAAYVFVRSGSSWSQQAYLKANNSGAGDYFGWSVAVAGDTVVVGAYRESSNATTINGDGSNNSVERTGAAYVFVRSGSSWSQQAYLKANNSGYYDQFGYSVAISGDTVVVGAFNESSNATTVNGNGGNDNAPGAGATYVFVRSGSSWSQQAYLKANNSGTSDYFGTSVAVAGDTVVVGAYWEDSNATTVNGDGSDNSADNSGATYVFVRSGSSWSQQAYLKANNSGASDQFGWSVAVSGNTVVVGAYQEDSNATTVDGNGSDNSASNAGAAYVFTLPPLVPEIDVQGNSVSIASGDTTPSLADHTDFGSVNVSSGTVVRTFTIQNMGNAALSVSTPTLTGANAGDFTISSAPAASVAANGYATFQITFDPSAGGARAATVSIGNNDSDENPYTFAIQGAGTVSTPNLSIPTSQRDASQGSFSVPVNFASNGASIAAVGFVLQYDQACLSFDATDSDSSGVPDAISGLPSGFVPSISHDANASALNIALIDNTAPIGALSDGALLTVAFTVKPACVTTDGSTHNVTLSFATDPAPSFSDNLGNDVNGTSSGATIPLHFNATPTAINLSNSSVAENAASGTTVGTLSTTDPDAGDTHTYALVTGAGDTDNASFIIEGNTLKTAAVFDFETKSSYTVRIRTTDNGGPNGAFERSFTINVTNVNEAPTALNLDHASIDENLAADATVGTFSTVDPDAGDSYTYALVSGTGDTDNASFTLATGVLKTAASFNYESKASYNIRVRTTDSGNLWREQTFTIQVNNLNEAPVAVNDPNDPTTTVFVAGQATAIDILANDTDEDGNPLSVQSVNTTGTQGSVTNNTSNVSYTAPNANGSSSFTYQSSDGLLTSNSATVNVTYVKNDSRGDCNANGAVSAADFIATVLEIFDANDTKYNNNPAWWLIYTGDYAGSPRGCDSNAGQNGQNHTSDSVGAGDIICTVLIFFKQTCGSSVVLAASPVTTPQMAVADTRATVGQAAQLTVNLNTASHQVAAATFALVIDPSQLNFDATDADADGVPDAVVLNIPASMSKSVTWDAAQSRLEVAVFGAALPLPTLSDGPLATVTFQVAATATPGATEVGLQLVTLSDTAGQDLTVAPSNGTLTISENTARTLLYLPVVVR